MVISPVYNIVRIERVIFSDALVALLYSKLAAIFGSIVCVKMLLRAYNMIVMYRYIERNRQLLNHRAQNWPMPKYLMNMNAA